MIDNEWEPVFIAANVSESEFVERMLADEGIEYDIRPEAFVRESSPGACFQGLMFLVLAGQAPYCRRLISQRGLTKGLVPSPERT